MSRFILVLGGNGFIGAEVVEHLLDFYNDSKLILLNRGHWDWDSKTRVRDRIFTSIKWNRKEDSVKLVLNEFLKDPDFKFEAVLDFSAYKRKDIQRVLRELPCHRFNVYILISSDSVYEVSIPNKGNENSTETDAVRPNSDSERDRLKKEDSYGHHKFGCEEVLLEKAQESSDLRYVIFRLADVIGARDSTERFWFYHMYFQYLSSLQVTGHEIRMPALYLSRQTSFTYVKDVARAVLVVLNSQVRNEIFNLACEQALSLKDFNQLLASIVEPGLENQLTYVMDEKSDYDLFPSVNRGPINVHKLKSMLQFEPSNINEALKESVQFYDTAYAKFPEERRSIEKSLKRMLFQTPEKVDSFDKFISQKAEEIYQNCKV